MSAILRWLLKQATRGFLGQIIKSVLESLGIWQFVVAVPIAISVAVKAMIEGSQAVSVALMFVVAAAVVVLLHYVRLWYERIHAKYFRDSGETTTPTWNKIEMGAFHIGQNEDEHLVIVTVNQDPLDVDLRWWPKDKVFCEYIGKNRVRCKRASDTARHEDIEIRYEIWTKQNGER